MSITARLLYQKETGLSLGTINKQIDNPLFEIEAICPTCEHHFTILQTTWTTGTEVGELLDYVEWLENLVEKVPPFLIP